MLESIYLNMYTAPALACCLINLFAVLLLQFVFEEKYAGLADNLNEEKVYVPPYDKMAVSLCHFTKFVVFVVWSNLETLGPPLAMAMFALSREQAVKYFASSHLAVGILAVSLYIICIVVKIDKYFDLRKVYINGLMGFILFHILTFSWPFLPERMETYSNKEYHNYMTNNLTSEPVGCQLDRFSWCESLSKTNIWLFFSMFVIVVGGFWTEIDVSLNTILSKVLGPRRQATQQSIFYTSGSFGRLIGPIIMGIIYSNFGPRISWVVEGLLLSVVISMWICLYKRMVPLIPADELKVNDKIDHRVDNDN